MDRPIIYTQEQGRSTDFLFGARSSMIGLAKLAEAMLGSNTFVSGLAVGPNSPAALNVVVGAGQVYALAQIDATAYGVLAADTTHSILKQGVILDPTTLACAAPITPGYSINYLIEAAFAETDSTNAVLPYFNSANPAQPLSGQNNSGAAQPTERQGVVSLIAKAGTAATTGTQTTPAADAGYVGLAVVTVAYGQTTITSGNIAAVSGAPILPSSGIAAGGFQGQYFTTSAAAGAADALTASFAPAVVTLTNGMTLYVRAASANATTTPSFTPNSGTIAAKTIVKGNGLALVAGDIAGAGHWLMLQYDSTLDKWILLNPATGVSVSAQVAGFRNRLINGSMSIDQRNFGSAQTITAGAALAYTVDRWWAACTGANVTGQQVAGTAPNQKNYQFTGAASVTGILFGQRIEAANSQDLAGSMATLSVDLSNSLLASVTWTAYYANTADTFGTLASPTKTQIATGTFVVNGTLARYNAQIAIPAAATTGIEIVLSVGAQTSGTWKIGRIQLEPGSVATAFEVRPISAELAMCQRYAYSCPINGASINSVTQANLGNLPFWMFFPVEMRASPTIGAISWTLGQAGTPSVTYSSARGIVFAAAYTVTNSVMSVTNSAAFMSTAEL